MSAVRTTVASLMVLVLAALVMWGCTDGEVVRFTLPLVPCERPPDPDLQLIRPAWGRHVPNSAVWVQENLAVMVGTGGLAMAWNGEGWQTEDPGTASTLVDVAGLDTGDVCAIGVDGVLTWRRGGSWSTVEVPVAGGLKRLRSGDDRFWAFGEEGALVEILDRDARVLPSPHGGGIHDVFAHADSLWALDGTDTLRVLVDGAWQSEAPARLIGKSIISLAALTDGRLVAMADSLYVREATGWWRPEVTGYANWHGSAARLRIIGDGLWILNNDEWSQAARVELGPDGWNVSEYYFDKIVAPLATHRVLTADYGQVTWYDPDSRRDPVGLPGSPVSLVRFLDGGNFVFSREFWLESALEGGLVPASPRSDDDWRSPVVMVGQSLEDYLYITSYASYVWRVRNHVPELVVEGLTTAYIRHGALFSNDDLVLFTEDHGVLRWREGAIDTVAAVKYVLRAAGPDLAVATRALTDDVYLINGDGVVATGLDRGFRAGGFLPDGRPVIVAERPRVDGRIYSDGNWIFVWEAATESLVAHPAPVAEECPELTIIGASSCSDGFYIWSQGASMVFRLAGDPAYEDWELVAGPLDNEIDDLVVQPDGSLVVIASGLTYWHSGRP